MSIVEQFKNRTPKSRRLFGRAVGAMPGGITHDLRRQHPYPLYVSHGEGSRKWDADGNEYIDYHGGHGALLLGHGRPEIVAAVRRQAARGTHLGGSHEQELRWAELVRDLIPSAEKVRFTASGTEAAMLALRLARAHSGRSKFIRFKGHFHGWYDQFVAGTDACERANNSGEALRRMLNQVLTDEKVPWSVYGEFSGFNLFTNPGDRRVLPLEFDPATIDPSELTGNDPELVGLVRLAMLINGVDVTPRFSGWISAVHEDRDLQKTAEAFQRTIGMLKKESVIAA